MVLDGLSQYSPFEADSQQGDIRIVFAFRKPHFEFRPPQLIDLLSIAKRVCNAGYRHVALFVWIGKTHVYLWLPFDFTHFVRRRVGEEPQVAVWIDVAV